MKKQAFLIGVLFVLIAEIIALIVFAVHIAPRNLLVGE